jgi:hypothetical protein
MLYEEPLKDGCSRRDDKRDWSGIRDQGLKEHLCVGSKRTLNKTFRQTIELEFAK